VQFQLLTCALNNSHNLKARKKFYKITFLAKNLNKKCFFIIFFLAAKLWEILKMKVKFCLKLILSQPKPGLHGIGLGIGLGLGFELGGARMLAEARYFSKIKNTRLLNFL